MGERQAIIDIGSNSVRLVVYGGPPRAPSVLLNEKVTARLGRNLGETGELSAKAMRAALAALGRYAALLKMMEVRDVQTVATAAVRDATNGSAFLDAVRALGLAPRLLSGEEEALTSAHGVMAAFPGATGVVADLGGGSLELTAVDGQSARHGVTLPFGTLRLDAMRAAGARKFALQVRQALRAAHVPDGAGLPLYVVGGSWRALARYAMAQLDWPLDDPHGWQIDTDAMLGICRTVAAGKLKVGVPRLAASRVAALPDAAALLSVLAREIGPSHLVFSAWGLREGLLFGRLSPADRALDPTLTGVIAFAEANDASPAIARMVAGWTAQVCDVEDQQHERLRLAAIMLALTAQRVEPNLRTDQAMNWALRKRWIGIGDRERAMLAAAATANTGRTELPPAFLRLASAADLRRATTWGLATRLCRKFSGCITHVLTASSLRCENGKLALAIDGSLQSLYTDAVAKDLRLLAGWLEAEPVAELGDESLAAR